jgi:hypothetical protein
VLIDDVHDADREHAGCAGSDVDTDGVESHARQSSGFDRFKGM